MSSTSTEAATETVAGLEPEEVLRDYRIAYRSRQVSVLARGEVMLGRAMFGIFGDGKEVAQVALARAFRNGDVRSGYYRDQTLMFALGLLDVRQFFAQLNAHADVEADPASGGRGMNAHFGTRMLDEQGRWVTLTDGPQSSADASPTGSQMPRLLGLAYASKLYRELEDLHDFTQFSRNGDEIAFGTIGNASCAEGVFWEALNAAGVLQVPMLVSVWDDGYGISVPNELQVAKDSISELVAGFQRTPDSLKGFEVEVVCGWDYPALVETYQRVAETVRREHVPALVHVVELTQPFGHSTSGSHERYKSADRLRWEKEHDGLARMRAWIVEEGLASEEELAALEKEEAEHVRGARDEAWQAYQSPIRAEAQAAVEMLSAAAEAASEPARAQVAAARDELAKRRDPLRRDIAVSVHRALVAVRGEAEAVREPLVRWRREQKPLEEDRFHSLLLSEGDESPLRVPREDPEYGEGSAEVDGYKILNAAFDAALKRDPRVIAFGEDVGKLGDVNQGFVDLQARYGELRVGDAGIREATIIGQAIGMAMRGLRPIAEIQYLDYLLYGLQVMSDDLATLRYRTKGGQKAPVIVRTRGHRLVGIWHSGSPMAMMLGALRGMHVLVPRDMTRAAGFYNLLLRSDDPAVVVEVLNGYRLKEKLPTNIGTLTTPLGVPEVLRQGSDVTLVTYGACCVIAMQAAKALQETAGIEVEVIDVQSLLPFDIHGSIVESLKKTNRVLFLDEDVPGGATAYMMQAVLERQGGFHWLDSQPRTLTAAAHRAPYGRDGDYWSKPNVEDVFDTVYGLMAEARPRDFPDLGT
ncbi:MAG TPA: thiamine pyrophosphate-dependent enzyme [Longimicrobiaceae bacterium]|jgi:pyruvate/2-oxoglutarate/acetoin dehydrogenase E1 component/TPP-dependent pyruvate/acetoin dehydrogenase alpha subunit|nr:thiamine pyrophosphate-dependent enzyme [Longimicrobiaceae bacterium]